MPNPRRYTDAQLSAAVASSDSWVAVAKKLGRNPTSGGSLKIVAAKLDLDVSHFDRRRSLTRVPMDNSPFTRRPSLNNGRLGIVTAAQWFLGRGYNVSLPIEAAPYDLIAESDVGLQRVQVKTTVARAAVKGTSTHSPYVVRITKKIYDPAIRNALGARRRVVYEDHEIDVFFIATGDGENYIIPLQSVKGITSLALDRKYDAFRV